MKHQQIQSNGKSKGLIFLYFSSRYFLNSGWRGAPILILLICLFVSLLHSKLIQLKNVAINSPTVVNRFTAEQIFNTLLPLFSGVLAAQYSILLIDVLSPSPLSVPNWSFKNFSSNKIIIPVCAPKTLQCIFFSTPPKPSRQTNEAGPY